MPREVWLIVDSTGDVWESEISEKAAVRKQEMYDTHHTNRTPHTVHRFVHDSRIPVTRETMEALDGVVSGKAWYTATCACKKCVAFRGTLNALKARCYVPEETPHAN